MRGFIDRWEFLDVIEKLYLCDHAVNLSAQIISPA